MNRSVDVLVVGGGPAGLTAARELRNLDVESVLVAERESVAGGIPRHSHHPGYGLRDLHRFMSGPNYARYLVEQAQDAGAVLETNLSITDWVDQNTLNVTSRSGRETIFAKAIILATGARERPRTARLVPGNRVRGVYTTGELQQAVYEAKLPIGSRAVIVGAEHVSYSALMTLSHANVKTVAMVTEFPKSQTYKAFKFGADLRFRVPLSTNTEVARVEGKSRVEAVVLRDGTGAERRVECDVVVFTGDWVADYEISERGGILRDADTTGPRVDQSLKTSKPHIFAAGNLLHPVTTADVAAIDGRHAAMGVARYLRGEVPSVQSVPINVAGPIKWIAPQEVVVGAGVPPRNCFNLWPTEFKSAARVEVSQAGSSLLLAKIDLIPNRPAELSASWVADVDPNNGPIQIRLG